MCRVHQEFCCVNAIRVPSCRCIPYMRFHQGERLLELFRNIQVSRPYWVCHRQGKRSQDCLVYLWQLVCRIVLVHLASITFELKYVTLYAIAVWPKARLPMIWHEGHISWVRLIKSKSDCDRMIQLIDQVVHWIIGCLVWPSSIIYIQYISTGFKI